MLGLVDIGRLLETCSQIRRGNDAVLTKVRDPKFSALRFSFDVVVFAGVPAGLIAFFVNRLVASDFFSDRLSAETIAAQSYSAFFASMSVPISLAVLSWVGSLALAGAKSDLTFAQMRRAYLIVQGGYGFVAQALAALAVAVLPLRQVFLFAFIESGGANKVFQTLFYISFGGIFILLAPLLFVLFLRTPARLLDIVGVRRAWPRFVRLTIHFAVVAGFFYVFNKAFVLLIYIVSQWLGTIEVALRTQIASLLN